MDEFYRIAVATIREIYEFHITYKTDHIDADQRPLLIGDVSDALQAYLGDGYEINIYGFSERDLQYPPTIQGMYIRRGKKIEILHEDQVSNYCRQRAIIGKELCHLFCMDDPTHFTNKPGDLIDSLLHHDELFLQDDTPLAKQQNNDNLARIVGLLVFFPMQEIVIHKRLIESGEMTNLQVAEKYRLPKTMVVWAMAETVLNFLVSLHKEAGVPLDLD